MAEKYTLNWHTFFDHLHLMFKDLYEDEKHSDVTLVCDDQTQFKAHKIVLRACSPVFKKIIDNNPSQHPLIYLRGIQSYEMESILQFIYLGEGRCYRERIKEFLKVAQDLEVKQISDGVELPIDEAGETVEDNSPKEDIEEDLFEEYPCKTEQANVRQRLPRSQISSDKEYSQCPECGAEFTLRHTMLRHFRSKHEGLKYPCDQCDYQFTDNSSLKKHIKAKHEGIRYPCNQCGYQATQKGYLKSPILYLMFAGGL